MQFLPFPRPVQKVPFCFSPTEKGRVRRGLGIERREEKEPSTKNSQKGGNTVPVGMPCQAMPGRPGLFFCIRGFFPFLRNKSKVIFLRDCSMGCKVGLGPGRQSIQSYLLCPCVSNRPPFALFSRKCQCLSSPTQSCYSGAARGISKERKEVGFLLLLPLPLFSHSPRPVPPPPPSSGRPHFPLLLLYQCERRRKRPPPSSQGIFPTKEVDEWSGRGDEEENKVERGGVSALV